MHKDGTVAAPVAITLKQDPDVFEPSPSASGRDDCANISGKYIDRNDYLHDNEHSSQDGSPRSNSADGLDPNGQPSSRPRYPRISNSRKPSSGGSKGDRGGTSGGGIFKQAAVEVLRQEGRLLTTGEITRLALHRQLINCSGKTPEATMASALYTDIKRKESQSVFIRPNEGKFGLREWVEIGGLPARFFLTSIQDAGLVSNPTVAAAATAAASAAIVSEAGPGALSIPPSSMTSAGGVTVPPSVQLPPQQQQQYHLSRPSSSTAPPPPPMFNDMPDGLMELLTAAEVAGEFSSDDDDRGEYDDEQGGYAAQGCPQYSDVMIRALKKGDRGGIGGEVGTYGSRRGKRKVGRPAKYRQPTSSGADFLTEVLRSQAGGGGGPGRRKRGASGGGGGGGGGGGRRPSRLGQQQQRATSSAYADEDEDDLLAHLGLLEDGVNDEDDEYEGSFSAAMMAMMRGGKRKRPVFTLPPPITYEAPRYVPPPVISPEQDDEERKKGGEASYYAPGAMEEKGNKEQLNSLNVSGSGRNSRKGKRGGSAAQQGGGGASAPPPQQQQQQQAAVEENLSLQQVEERVASLEQTLGTSHPEVGKGYLYLARMLMADSTMPEQSRRRAELALTRAQEIMTVCQYAMRRTEGPSCGLSFAMVHQQIYLAAAAAAMHQHQQQQLGGEGQGGPGVNNPKDGAMDMDPHSLAAIAAAAAVAPFYSP